MALFVISYDLRKQRNYDSLIKQLRNWGCIRPLLSVWLGELSGTAVEVRDALKVHIDQDDGLMVIELKPGSGWGTYKVNENASDWLRTHIAR